MGANYFEIEALVKRHNVQVFSTNFVLYADMSMRMKGLLSRFCPEVEDYSIDEAFWISQDLRRQNFATIALKWLGL